MKRQGRKIAATPERVARALELNRQEEARLVERLERVRATIAALERQQGKIAD